MSGVVPLRAHDRAGRAFVPKPRLPVFHDESSKLGFSQPSAGFSVVYRHSAGSSLRGLDERHDVDARALAEVRLADAALVDLHDLAVVREQAVHLALDVGRLRVDAGAQAGSS